MIVLLNGSFGVGKSTVARRLRSQLPRARIFNPEHVGWVLTRLPGWFPHSAKHLTDYQDAPAWRYLTARMAACLHRPSGVLLLPMTFTNRSYLDEIVLHFDSRKIGFLPLCLTAPEDVIRSRLSARGLDPASRDGRWILPRVATCCAAHRSGEFGEEIATGQFSPDEVAAMVRDRIEAFDRMAS